MGTSSSYSAPSTGKWPDAKSAATRFASDYGERGATGAHNVTASYVAALGGAAAAVLGAIAGRRTATALGSFLGRAADAGLDTALRERGLERYIGLAPLDVIAALVDSLVGESVSPEEAVDRDALLAVFDAELLQAVTYEDLELLLVDSLDAAGIARLLELFIAEYVYRRLLLELGKQLANGARTPSELPAIETDLRAYVVLTIKIRLEGVDVLHLDWGGPDGAKVIEAIFRAAYEQIE